MKLALILLAFFFSYASGQTKPHLRYADEIRIREAMNLSDRFGDQLFDGYSKIPFAIILVTDSTEFLINHPNPSPDYSLAGQDSILQGNIYYRKRQYDPHFLATFPAVNGLSCIVVGTPENTNKNSTEWIITLLHEHFHQYQSSFSGYYKSVENLQLSKGDQTGMWMLNYAFPYDSVPVIKQYVLFAQALHNAVANIHTKAFNSYLEQYMLARQKFKNVLSPDDYRYFSFQIWQEGLARHTEYNFLELLLDYSPSKEVIALPDYMPFNELKSKMYDIETNNLLNNKLNESKRVCFYSIGFAEGMLLDKLNRSWRKKYLTDKFYIEHYYKHASNN